MAKEIVPGSDSTTVDDDGVLTVKSLSGFLSDDPGSARHMNIGVSAAEQIGFYGVTPVNQPDAVADATGAGDVVAQLNALLARMRELGLIAT